MARANFPHALPRAFPLALPHALPTVPLQCFPLHFLHCEFQSNFQFLPLRFFHFRHHISLIRSLQLSFLHLARQNCHTKSVHHLRSVVIVKGLKQKEKELASKDRETETKMRKGIFSRPNRLLFFRFLDFKRPSKSIE